MEADNGVTYKTVAIYSGMYSLQPWLD